MNLHNTLCSNVILFVILVLVNFIGKCSCLCGNSFSVASAIVVINEKNENFVANKCVKNLSIEKFQLLSSTRIIYPGTFSNLFRLHTIELNNAGITKVEPGFLENTPVIKRIKIESNKLESISRYTFDQIRLDILDLSSNSINQIANNAFESSKIEYLCLSNNKLDAINPDWFQDTSITVLSMSHNLVTALDAKTFSGTKGMKSLKLSYNKLRSIHHKTFSEMTSLQIVYLSGNELETVDFEMKGSLRNVDVSFNTISYLSADDYTPLWIMSVYPNPFECACLREFWKFIDRKRIKLWDTKSLKNPWKDEYPLCIAKYERCTSSKQGFAEVREEYFKIINYDVLGRPNYRKEDDFVDLGIVN